MDGIGRRATALAALGALLFGCRVQEAAANGAPVALAMETVRRDGSALAAIYTVRNSLTADLAAVLVECAFRDGGATVIDVVSDILAAIPAGGEGHGKTLSFAAGATVADCRITAAR